jgi:hypothetical protein
MLTKLKLKNMNYRNSIFKFMGIAAMALAVTSCTVDEAQDVPLVQLGALEKEFVVEADASTLEIDLYANSAYRLERINESEDWLTFTYGDIVVEEGVSKSKITVETTFNEGFKRAAGLVLCSEMDGRRDTLYVKQKALIEAKLQFGAASLTLPGKGGQETHNIVSNIPFEDVTVEIAYADEANAGWVESIVIEDAETEERQMVMTLAANESEEAPRAAAVSMSFTDGWGDQQLVEFNLLQRTSKETFGNPISMEDFCNKYATGKKIEDYVLLEGIVVSNKHGLNAGEPEQQTSSVVDYVPSKTTVYLQTPDGSRGIAVVCATEEDNVFEQWDHVQLLIHGTTGVLKENPDRYELNGVNKTMITVREAGQKSDIAVKNKTIAQLTDADIYTYVNIQDVYFPVRKGSLCPYNEGYALGTGADRIAKFPRLMLDKDGNEIHLFTNSNCMYRGNGRRLPYGSGYVSGVIVHERFARFNWRDGADLAEIADDPELGYIGRYGIRHQTEGDVFDNLADSVEDSFAAILCEYRWWNPSTELEACLPTYGNNGWFTHTYQPKYTGDPTIGYKLATYKQHMSTAGNYCYLGPVGNGDTKHFGANYGNMNGCGMIIDTAKEHFIEDATLGACLSRNPDGTIEWAGPCASSKYVAEGNSTTTGHPDKAAYLAGNWGKGFTTGGSLPTNSNAINYNGSTSMRGKANAYGGTYNGWAHNQWWNYDTNTAYAWLINVNMSKVTYAQKPSLQISCLNSSQTWYSPRFWAVEWSTSDDQKGVWSRIEEYTVPDVSVWSNSLFSSIVAYKGMNFMLPEAMCGLENVYIRLIPISDICSDGGDYANDVIANGATPGNSAIEYIAIRYNK